MIGARDVQRERTHAALPQSAPSRSTAARSPLTTICPGQFRLGDLHALAAHRQARAGFLHAEPRQHRACRLGAGALHQLAATFHEAEPVLEGDGAGSGQGAVLARLSPAAMPARCSMPGTASRSASHAAMLTA